MKTSQQQQTKAEYSARESKMDRNGCAALCDYAEKRAKATRGQQRREWQDVAGDCARAFEKIFCAAR